MLRRKKLIVSLTIDGMCNMKFPDKMLATCTQNSVLRLKFADTDLQINISVKFETVKIGRTFPRKRRGIYREGSYRKHGSAVKIESIETQIVDNLLSSIKELMIYWKDVTLKQLLQLDPGKKQLAKQSERNVQQRSDIIFKIYTI